MQGFFFRAEDVPDMKRVWILISGILMISLLSLGSEEPESPSADRKAFIVRAHVISVGPESAVVEVMGKAREDLARQSNARVEEYFLNRE